MSYYVIADIHGRKDLLDLALEEIYSRQDGGTIIFLGDYVDRGPDSGGVVQHLMEEEPEDWEFICLMGNHEDMFVNDFTKYGGLNNCMYDKKVLKSFYDKGMDMDKVLRWMENLRLYHIVDDNIFVHADWDETKSEKEQLSLNLIWGRRLPKSLPFNSEKYHLTHGHTPDINGPIRVMNRTNLDICAYNTGNLCIGVYEYGRKGPVDFVKVCV